MRKKILNSLVILSLIFSSCYVRQALAEEDVYKIGMIHWIAYSPLNVADVKGFWKAQGINVEVINFGNNRELNIALQKKRIHIALDMMGSWVGMYVRGVPLTIIGETDWSHGGDKIIVRKGFDPSSLKGKPVGVYLNKPSVTYFLDQYFRSENLKLSDVHLIEVEPETMSDKFIKGQFMLIVNYNPQALRAEREGNGVIAATSADYPGCIPEGFVARTDILRTIPKESLAKIFEGWIRAVKWSKDRTNWDEYRKILNEKTFEGEEPYTDRDLREMLASVRIHDVREQLERNRDGGGLTDYLVKLKAFLKANGKLGKGYQPESVFDNEVIVRVLKGHN